MLCLGCMGPKRMRRNCVCYRVHVCLWSSTPGMVSISASVHSTVGQEFQGPVVAVGSLHSRFFLNVLYYKPCISDISLSLFFFFLEENLTGAECSLGPNHFLQGSEVSVDVLSLSCQLLVQTKSANASWKAGKPRQVIFGVGRSRWPVWFSVEGHTRGGSKHGDTRSPSWLNHIKRKVARGVCGTQNFHQSDETYMGMFCPIPSNSWYIYRRSRTGWVFFAGIWK